MLLFSNSEFHHPNSHVAPKTEKSVPRSLALLPLAKRCDSEKSSAIHRNQI
jgi:hypothetical protein